MYCKTCRKQRFNILDVENIELIGECLLCEQLRAEQKEEEYYNNREKENEDDTQSETSGTG